MQGPPRIARNAYVDAGLGDRIFRGSNDMVNLLMQIVDGVHTERLSNAWSLLERRDNSRRSDQLLCIKTIRGMLLRDSNAL